MAAEPQFHITVVVQERRNRQEDESAGGRSGKRRHSQESDPAHTREEAAAPAPEPASSAAAAGPGEHAVSRGNSSRHHRRRYQDYGTINLGSLDSHTPEERVLPADHGKAVPSQEELQPQFFHKYDAVLSRRCSTSSRAKVTRYMIVALLVVLIFFAGLFGISAIHSDVAETLEAPVPETIPVGTLDLGD